MMKKLKGNKTTNNQHFIRNNIKLMEDEEKEEAFREIRQEVFKIRHEENREFDGGTEEEVEEFLMENENKLRPYELSNTNRLQGDQEIDTLITTEEIKGTIKKFRKNTPGESIINKVIIYLKTQ